jgi:membrane protease YdiL (CAAX protease family)
MPFHEQVAGTAVLALVVFGVAGWIQAAIRRRRGEPLISFEARRPAPWTFFDLLAVFVVYVAVQLGAALVVRAIFGAAASLEKATAEQLTALLLAQGTANLLAASCGAAIALSRAGAKPRDLGVSWKDAARDVRLGVGAFFMLAMPVMLLQAALTHWWPSEHPLVLILRNNATWLLFVVGVIVAVVIAPLTEEFFFRVLLQGWLEKAGGKRRESEANTAAMANPPQRDATSSAIVVAEIVPSRPDENPYAANRAEGAVVEKLAESEQTPPPPYWPIFVSAAVFALMHFSHGPDPIPLFLLALGLGYLYRQTHRLLPSVTVHFLLNGMSMALLWMELMYGKK